MKNTKKLLILSFVIATFVLSNISSADVLNLSGTYSGNVNGTPLAATLSGYLDTTGTGTNHIEVNFSSISATFPPYALCGSIVTFYCPAALEAIAPALNMWDLTGGNYAVDRQFSWPEYPGSSITATANVLTTGSNMYFTSTVNGTYTGPTNLIGIVNPVEINWTQGTGNNVNESNHGVVLRQGGGTFDVDYTSIFSGLSQPLPGDQFGEYNYSNMSWDGTTMLLDWSGTIEIPEPATVALLSLGALSLLRRKRKA